MDRLIPSTESDSKKSSSNSEIIILSTSESDSETSPFESEILISSTDSDEKDESATSGTLMNSSEDSANLSNVEDDINSDQPKLIKTSRTYQEWLTRFSEIFENYYSLKMIINEEGDDTMMKSPNMKEFWFHYLETLIDPIGWIAHWLKKDYLHPSGPPFPMKPSLGTVAVTQLDQITMMATVSPIDCPGFGDSWEIPVWELRPIKDQDSTFINLKLTTECLNDYRFYREELSFPWDTDDAKKWFDENLELRINFFHDLDTGVFSATDTEKYKGLIREVKLSVEKIEELDESLEGSAVEGSQEEDDTLMEILSLQMRVEEIGNTMKRTDNPIWRSLMKKLELKSKAVKEPIVSQFVLVCSKTSTEYLSTILRFVSGHVQSSDEISIVSSLENALSSCSPGGKIFLTAGIHRISGLSKFEKGGTIMGIRSLEQFGDVVVEPDEIGDVWLMVDIEESGCLDITGITFRIPVNPCSDALQLKTGFLVNRGRLNMSYCSIIGNEYTASKPEIGPYQCGASAIHVMKDGSLDVFDVKISQFNVSVEREKRETQIQMEET